MIIVTLSKVIKHICTGLNPENNSGNEGEKKFWRNFVIYMVGLSSVLLHIFVWVKIKMYKRKCDEGHSVLKKTFLLTLENQSLTSMLTGLCHILFTCLCMTLLYHLNSMDCTKTNFFPNNILIYFYHFAMLSAIFISNTIIFYIRLGPMRAVIIRELREHLNFFVHIPIQ